jgi:putative membrane protein
MLLIIAHAGPLTDMYGNWTFEPVTCLLLILSLYLYARGGYRLWDQAGRGKGLSVWRVQCYAIGWVALAAALISPIHSYGERYFWVHMLQHEILMLVAAPFLVLSRPLIAMSWGLPIVLRSKIGRLQCSLRNSWAQLSRPIVAWGLHAVALWVWHLPSLFAATLESDWIHAAQHFSFFFSGLLFTWVAIETKRTAAAHGTAIIYLFTTAIHTSILGALLAFSSTPWYEAYGLRSIEASFTVLDDQRLGGLIMWIPGGVVYLLLAVLIGYRMLSLPYAQHAPTPSTSNS